MNATFLGHVLLAIDLPVRLTGSRGLHDLYSELNHNERQYVDVLDEEYWTSE